MHRPHSTHGSRGLPRSHRAQNPAPTPGWRPCTGARERSVWRSASASSDARSVRLRDTHDGLAYGSPPLLIDAAAHAIAGIRSAASLWPTPPDAHAGLHLSFVPDNGRSKLRPSEGCTLAAG